MFVESTPDLQNYPNNGYVHVSAIRYNEIDYSKDLTYITIRITDMCLCLLLDHEKLTTVKKI